MQLHSMALLEDCESIQLSIMHVVDGLVKGTLEPTRARLILQALRIAARNAKNVRFDKVDYLSFEPPMVRQVPDYARQYLIEHPEQGPPLSPCGADTPAREAEARCSADTPVREAETNSLAQRQEPAKPATPQPIVSQQSAAPETAAKRQQNAAHSASCGSTTENDPAPKERKKPERDTQQEANELKRVQAAIAGVTRGNWRDLRTVFEFAGITPQNKEAP